MDTADIARMHDPNAQERASLLKEALRHTSDVEMAIVMAERMRSYVEKGEPKPKEAHEVEASAPSEPPQPDLLFTMLSALPSRLLSRAESAARSREFDEKIRRERREVEDAERNAGLEVLARQMAASAADRQRAAAKSPDIAQHHS